MSVFGRRIRCYSYGLNKCLTERRAETRNTTAPVSCSNSTSFCCNRTSTHKPRTGNFSWTPDSLQSDIDTDRAMVSINTRILITNTNFNDFQIRMNSVFNTISEWFVANPLSPKLNTTIYGIKVFRMHKYITRIMMSCKKENHVTTYSENEKYCPYDLNIYFLYCFL
jgi:hypothetical protein